MYNAGNIKEKIQLSYEEIFRIIGEENVYFKYLGFYPDVNKKITSPFSTDKTPSLSFKMYDKLIFKCFSTGKGGDAISFVSNLYSESYESAAKRISNDFSISKETYEKHKIQNTNKYVRFDTEIQVVLQDFSNSDLEYWQKVRILKERLDFYDVKVIEKAWLNKGNGWFIPSSWIYKKNNPIFRYRINGRYKLYKPLETNKAYKWLCNTNNKDVQGFNQLPQTGKNLIITKSMKDVLCWDALGYPSIAQCSESQPLTDQFLNYFFTRFDNIYINYDFDQSGIKEAEKYSLPKIFTGDWENKDPYALITNRGFSYAESILKQQII